MAAEQEFSLYKSQLRDLIRIGNVYYIAPRPDGARCDGLEFVSPDKQNCAVYCFRGSTSESSQMYRAVGQSPSAAYRVYFADHSQSDFASNGRQLMKLGVTIQLADAVTSQIAFLSIVHA